MAVSAGKSDRIKRIFRIRDSSGSNDGFVFQIIPSILLILSKPK
jgi:hypothetical protein